MIESISEASRLIAALGIVLTAGWSLVRVVKLVLKWIRVRILNRIDELEKCSNLVVDDIRSSSEENMIIMRGLKATLEAVAQNKCNGNVTSAIAAIDEYTLENSHKPKSNASKKEGNEDEREIKY